MPEEFKDAWFYRALCQHDGNNLQFVPEAQINTELCLMALKKNLEAWKWIPEKYKDFCGFSRGVLEKSLDGDTDGVEISDAIRNEILLITAILEPNNFTKLAGKLSIDKAVADEILEKRQAGVNIPRLSIASTDNPLAIYSPESTLALSGRFLFQKPAA